LPAKSRERDDVDVGDVAWLLSTLVLAGWSPLRGIFHINHIWSSGLVVVARERDDGDGGERESHPERFRISRDFRLPALPW